MNIQKLRDLTHPDNESPRVAELAALFVMRSLTFLAEPGQRSGATVETGKLTPVFGLSYQVAARVAEKLVTHAGMLEYFAVIDCNRGLTPNQQRTRDLNAEKVRELAEALGFRVETSGDPRGCVVKLYDPADERAGEGWGGGWGVYR